MLTENIIFLIQSLHLVVWGAFLLSHVFFEFPCFWTASGRFFFFASPNLRDLMRGVRRLGRSSLIDTSHTAN